MKLVWSLVSPWFCCQRVSEVRVQFPVHRWFLMLLNLSHIVSLLSSTPQPGAALLHRAGLRLHRLVCLKHVLFFGTTRLTPVRQQSTVCGCVVENITNKVVFHHLCLVISGCPNLKVVPLEEHNEPQMEEDVLDIPHILPPAPLGDRRPAGLHLSARSGAGSSCLHVNRAGRGGG